MTDSPDQTLRRALACARRSWPVFPCQPGGKQPATRHGFPGATTDPDLIRWWWRRLPGANLAVATGAPGPDVLDVDQREAGSGHGAFARLRHAGLAGRARVIVATPGGELHARYAGKGQPSGRLPGHHLDFKARGGYILALPSAADGRPYRLVARPGGTGALDWAAVTSFPEPGRDRQARRDGPAPADAGRLAAQAGQQGEGKGNRNNGLFWAACRAINGGRDGDLRQIAAAAARSGLGDHEIIRTIASARRPAGRACEPHTEPEATR